MTDAEKLLALREADRLGLNYIKAQSRFQSAQPRSRGAYHAHVTRAKKQLAIFNNRLREQGYHLLGPIDAHTIHAMDEEELRQYRNWKAGQSDRQCS